MEKKSTSCISGIGVYAVTPKRAIAPRRRVQRRVDERADEEPALEQAPPPPGMGALVDKSA